MSFWRYGESSRKIKYNKMKYIVIDELKDKRCVKMSMEINIYGFLNLIPTLFVLIKSSALITSIANIILLIGMLYVYLERYLKVKSKFTTTLVLFSLLFLIQNILFSIYFVFNLPETLINALLPLIFLGLEFTALTLLLMITRE